MRSLNRAILYIVFIGIVAIQLATLIDDPQHLLEPDPNCPICLAAKTEVCITPHLSISFTPDIILFLVEMAVGNQGKEDHLSILSIRAPPVS